MPGCRTNFRAGLVDADPCDAGMSWVDYTCDTIHIWHRCFPGVVGGNDWYYRVDTHWVMIGLLQGEYTLPYVLNSIKKVLYWLIITRWIYIATNPYSIPFPFHKGQIPEVLSDWNEFPVNSIALKWNPSKFCIRWVGKDRALTIYPTTGAIKWRRILILNRTYVLQFAAPSMLN